MPEYNGTRMRLGVTDLSETVLSDSRQSGGVAKSSEAFETKLKESALLKEEVVPFPGDVRQSKLSYLNGVPFQQVQVGDEDTKGQSMSGLAIGPPASNDTMPKALSLHVFLSENSFIPISFEDDTPQTLKIEIFFNGMLSSRVLAQYSEVCHKKYVMKKAHQLFAGTRVDLYLERPWIIFPPGQDANRSLRSARRDVDVKQRWNQICEALIKEADERGLDQQGRRAPSADYLASLASMEMPECLDNTQKPAGRSLGVVDVVMTAGYGRKDTALLRGPTRMSNERYKRRGGEEQKHEHVVGQPAGQEQCWSDQDAEGDTDPEPHQPPPLARRQHRRKAGHPPRSKTKYTPNPSSMYARMPALGDISTTVLPPIQTLSPPVRTRSSFAMDLNSDCSSLSSVPSTLSLEANPFKPEPERMSLTSSQEMDPSVVISRWPSSYNMKRKLKEEGKDPIPENARGNPPLNQGSVIQFAESGKPNTYVLRQVRGEKGGVFDESQVVVGMRFLKPG